MATELRLNYSRMSSELGPENEPTRSTEISNIQLALNANFEGERFDVEAGGAFRMIDTKATLGGLFQNVNEKAYSVDHFSLYVEPEYKMGNLRIRPGVRMEFYSIRVDPYIEPRFRFVWSAGDHQISGAAGLYHQEEVGLSDRRDAASVFTAWTIIPQNSARETSVLAENIPRAIHALLGYRVSPVTGIEVSLEGFYKDIDNLFVGEWTSYPQFTTKLQPATGRSSGLDARIEIRRAPFYGFVNYGLSSTMYEAKQANLTLWYGQESLRYRPPHDRRHQLNALANIKVYGFDVSARWEFGSGLPFSRPVGFDGFILVDDVDINPYTNGSRRVIYERPYNSVLPTYHRLDFSVERTFSTKQIDLTLQASMLNVYDRRNIFYVDVFTLRRADQLPLVPSLGLRLSFR